MLSGRLCTGKTTVARALTADGIRLLVSARAALRKRAGAPLESRAELQAFGAATDLASKGGWLADCAKRETDRYALPVVVDSARTAQQVARLRSALGDNLLHVHLLANEEVRTERFRRRQDADMIEAGSFHSAEAGEAAGEDRSLEQVANLVLDTSRAEAAEVVDRVLASLENASRPPSA